MKLMYESVLFFLLCVLQTRTSAVLENVTEASPSCSTASPHKSLACSETSCPPGLFCNEGRCECGKDYPYVFECAGSDASVLSRYCATFDFERNLTLVGACLFTLNSTDFGGTFPGNTAYHLLPKTTKKLNTLCHSYNRTGDLCGRCLPDHYPMAYSFNMTCIPCPHVRWSWFRYIMAAYVPLTCFYMIVIFFKINVTSSHLFAVVYYCQALSMPCLVRSLLIGIAWNTDTKVSTLSGVFASFYGIWNLDFFRPFYSDLCLGMGILPTLALDYAIAVYPLLLMVVTYLLIALYDKNYRIITILWTPFRRLFSLFRKNWDIRTSVIDAFATFFLLSSTKFLSVSLDLLTPTKVYQLYPDHYNYTLRLYYAQDIEYFSKEHLPYAILAIVVLCAFIAIPIATLALYPFRFFRWFLNLFPFRCHFLHIFVDSFQGFYKDGTEPGTLDCRWFASMFFVLRCLQISLFLFMDLNNFVPLSIITLVLMVSLLALFQPFKPSMSHLNIINIVFLQFLILFATAMAGLQFAFIMSPLFIHFFITFGGILVTTPLLYAIGVVSHWIYTHKKSGVSLVQRWRAIRNGYRPIYSDPSEHLPDRIENAGDYPQKNLANFSVVSKKKNLD